MFALGLRFRRVVKKRRGVDFRQRSVRRGEVGMAGNNFRHLLSRGGSIAPHQAASIR